MIDMLKVKDFVKSALNDKKIMLALLCALLFSTSSWMVDWLKESFTAYGQLTYRAAAGVVVTALWFFVTTLIDRTNINKKVDGEGKRNIRQVLELSKFWFVVFLFLRPTFNLFFINAISDETWTIALMILLFVKMLTNVLIDSINSKSFPSKEEVFGYFVVLAGIGVFSIGKDDVVLKPILWFAFGSGVLEAARLELIGWFKIKESQQPKFAVVEFFGMLGVAIFYLVSAGEGFFNIGVTTLTLNSVIAMVVFPVIAVGIMALDYYLSSVMEKGQYSAILATEIGFAGVLNAVFLYEQFGIWQFIGLVLSVSAIIAIKIAKDKKEKKAEEKRKIQEEKNRGKEIMLEG